jgi:ABC-type cobalamin transport system permease subunit
MTDGSDSVRALAYFRACGALVRLVAPEVMRLVGLTDEQAEKVAAAIVAACGASATTVLPLAARLDQLARLLRAGVEPGGPRCGST